MRWRLLDRVDSFDPWKQLRGRKAVSFEEYSLLKPFGRKGAFPETLVVESCVTAVRWLAVRSSEFRRTAILTEAEAFTFYGEARAGNVLEILVNTRAYEREVMAAECIVCVGDARIAHGCVSCELVELDKFCVSSAAHELWGQLYAEA